MKTRTLLLLSLVVSAVHAWKYETPYFMPAPRLVGEAGSSDTAWYFDTTAKAGLYPRTTSMVHEGGWSGLEFDPSDASGASFWTVSEGGLVTSRENATRNDRVIAFPGYHQKLVHVSFSNDSLQIDQTDSIASWSSPSVYTNGLSNTLSTSDAVLLKMNLATGVIDSTATLSPSASGYDFEAIRYQGGFFWLSDESGPFILKVNPSTHRIDKQWYPDNGLPKVYLRRRSNRSFEAMATTPSGLVAAMVQSPMYNAQGTVENITTRDSRVMRLLLLDPTTGAVREFVYLNDQKPNALGATRKGRDCKVGDMIALDDSRFLVVEHGANAAGKYWIDLWEIDISKATNVTATNKIGITFSNGDLTLEQLSDSATLVANGVTPVAKKLVRADLAGTTPWTSTQPEGLGIVDDTTVALLSDDNYGCRDMDADGGPDGICHTQRGNISRSILMYFKVPSLSWARTAAHHAVRPAPFRIGAVPGAALVSWSARHAAFTIEAMDLEGRLLGRWKVSPSGAGRRVFPVGNASGAILVRVREAGSTQSGIIAIP